MARFLRRGPSQVGQAPSALGHSPQPVVPHEADGDCAPAPSLCGMAMTPMVPRLRRARDNQGVRRGIGCHEHEVSGALGVRRGLGCQEH